VVCEPERSDIAISLLKTTLGRLKGLEVSMCVPKKEAAIFKMRNASFKESFTVARMFFGLPTTDKCIYMPESLERG
jgi:hypothetical protein